jgi:hypothetical protein
MSKIEGGCHCKNIEYAFETTMPIEQLYFRECGCTFCSKQGAIYTSDPSGIIDINIKDKEKIIIYTFSTEVVEFIICKQCGVMPYVVMRLDQALYAVINIRTSNIDLAGKEIKKIKINTETKIDSIKRRLKYWSKLNVSYKTSR